MKIYTTTEAKNKLQQIIDLTTSSHQPIYIVGKKNKAVVIAEDEYSAIIETLYLNSIPGMKDSILKADKQPIDKCKTDLNW